MTNYSLFHFPTVVRDAEAGEFGNTDPKAKYLDPSTRYVVLLGTLEKLKRVLYQIVDFVDSEVKPEGTKFKEWFATDEAVNDVLKQLPNSWKTVLTGAIKIINALGDAFKANMIHHLKKDYDVQVAGEKGDNALFFFFLFATRGNYESKTKNYFKTHSLEMIKQILK
jgi:hypothetical protein